MSTNDSILHISILSDSVEELYLKVTGDDMEMQQLQLVIEDKLEPETVFEANIYNSIFFLRESLTGDIKVEMVIESKI